MITTLSKWIENNQGKWFLIGLTVMVLGCALADSLTLSDEQRAMEQQQ